MRDVEYNRDAAVSYAHTWAYKRNPRYADFAGMGGDCTNFVSQALYAGSGIMNYTPTFGWYYRNINDRAPAWTGVQYLYNFLTTNKGVGPVAVTADLGTVEPGDVVQLSFDGSRFAHTAIIVAVSGNPPTPGTVLVAAHEIDCDYRPLDTYIYQRVRFLHITHVRKW
ncbi:MAG: amidase domain-containing protein [Eubacteriales bacterium]|jgi:hypothetical protein